MPVNRDKPDRWKEDIAKSVDLYNEWFLKFAPGAFRETRIKTTNAVQATLTATGNLANLTPEVLRLYSGILPTLRMSTCPPLARDRLVGLAGVAKSLVESMEKRARVPRNHGDVDVDTELRRICETLWKLADRDVFPWLDKGVAPSEVEVRRAATIVADRLCGATADPIVRNAQEARQLNLIKEWLDVRGYQPLASRVGVRFNEMRPGTYAFRMNVTVNLEGGQKRIRIPVDAVVMPKRAELGSLPLLVEAKSAGDYTNVNKRRKEEAKKVQQIRATYGNQVRYILFLCGYFDTGYLGYEAAEGIDWVWEHRMSDLELFGL
jgi:hypothetical protein